MNFLIEVNKNLIDFLEFQKYYMHMLENVEHVGKCDKSDRVYKHQYIDLCKKYSVSLGIRKQGLPRWSQGQELTCKVQEDLRDSSSLPGSGRSPEAGMVTHFSILAWRIS